MKSILGEWVKANIFPNNIFMFNKEFIFTIGEVMIMYHSIQNVNLVNDGLRY